MDNVLLLPASRFLADNKKIFTRLDSGNGHIAHSHEFFEILYVIQGEYCHVFDEYDQQTLKIGDCVIVPPYQTHSFRSKHKHIIKRDILVEKEYFEQLCALVPDSIEIINNHFFERILNFSIDELNTIEHFFSMFNQETDLRLRQALALPALCIIINKFFKTHNSRTSTLASRIIEKISQPPYLSNGLDALAKEFNYTPQYLCSYFKKHTRMTLTDYVNKIKLSRIEFYLLNSEMSMREIADIVQIESLSYMNKLFLKKYGITPKKYRIQNSPTDIQQLLSDINPKNSNN